MNRLLAAVYDPIMSRTEEACLLEWRRELLGGVAGEVLELGAGTGRNVELYPATLQRLVLTEPHPAMFQQLQTRVAQTRRGHVMCARASAEQLPFSPRTFDFVVVTLVLCSVSDVDRTLGEIRRVLRPGGQLVFMEHVAAEDRPGRLRLQRFLEPAWKRLAGNCHLTRRTADALAQAGFRMERVRRESMRKAPAFVRPMVLGVARRD
ncbi:MAG: class I SAM-dependent methyltransferase [Myxococcota bacterium]